MHTYYDQDSLEKILEGEREKRNVTVLSYLVPAEFRQTQKGTRNRHHLVLANLTIEGTEGLVYLNK
jgi:hypothetical protein